VQGPELERVQVQVQVLEPQVPEQGREQEPQAREPAQAPERKLPARALAQRW
jgi:hypothetical protein